MPIFRSQFETSEVAADAREDACFQVQLLGHKIGIGSRAAQNVPLAEAVVAGVADGEEVHILTGFTESTGSLFPQILQILSDTLGKFKSNLKNRPKDAYFCARF